MSRPRFLTDHDFNENIIDGVLRREPAIEISRVREHGLEQRPDAEILQFAADRGLLVLSHDVNTMTAAAYARIEAGQSMPGLLMVKQTEPLGGVIQSIVLIWSASEFEEWANEVWFLPL